MKALNFHLTVHYAIAITWLVIYRRTESKDLQVQLEFPEGCSQGLEHSIVILWTWEHYHSHQSSSLRGWLIPTACWVTDHHYVLMHSVNTMVWAVHKISHIKVSGVCCKDGDGRHCNILSIKWSGYLHCSSYWINLYEVIYITESFFCIDCETALRGMFTRYDICVCIISTYAVNTALSSKIMPTLK